MKSILKLLSLVTIVSLLVVSASIADEKAPDFRGHWRWGLYADHKDELPPAYRDMPLSKVPEYSLELDITQKVKKISGHYLCTWRFLSKIEEGEFAAEIKGNEAYLHLESGFGGTVKVRLLRQNNALLWEVINRNGEDYFHNRVTLTRPVESIEKLPSVAIVVTRSFCGEEESLR